MKKLVTLMSLMTAAFQFTSVAQANGSSQYRCEIQQMDFDNGAFIKKTYAQGDIDASNFGTLVVDMPRFANDPEKMRVILTIGPSLDKSKVHVDFSAVDKHGSTEFSKWDAAFQILSELELGTPFISLQSANAAYMAEFSCKLLSQ